MSSLTSKTEFLEEDSNDSTPVSKTPDMDSDMPTLEAWLSSLPDAEKIKAFHEVFLPYAQKREDELKKLRKWFERQLKSPLKRMYKQEVKRKQRSTAAKAKSGFNKSEELPKPLFDFLKKNISEDILKNADKNIEIKKEMPRPKVTSLLVLYAKEKKLVDNSNKRIIHPDSSLKKLFGLKKNEDIDIFKGMQKMLKAFYDKYKKEPKTTKKQVTKKTTTKKQTKKTKKEESSESEMSSSSSESESESDSDEEEEKTTKKTKGKKKTKTKAL